jgi:hypothetical protein
MEASSQLQDPPTPYTRGKIPDTHLRGEWVGPRTGLDAIKKSLRAGNGTLGRSNT